MRCAVESIQLVGTTCFTKESLDEVEIKKGEIQEVSSPKSLNEYLKGILTPSVKYDKNGDVIEDEYDEFVCGICQISFSRHCCHCTVPSEIKVDTNKIVHRIEIEPKKFVKIISNVHNGCSLAQGMCGHYFHYHCIEKWLEVPDAAGKCPMCRQDFVEYE